MYDVASSCTLKVSPSIRGSSLKGKNLPLQKQILSFKSWSLFRREKKMQKNPLTRHMILSFFFHEFIKHIRCSKIVCTLKVSPSIRGSSLIQKQILSFKRWSLFRREKKNAKKTKKTSKFGEIIFPRWSGSGLFKVHFKFHKILFTCYWVMAYLWILNQGQ